VLTARPRTEATRRREYTIRAQRDVASRHPAWTRMNGFPEAESSEINQLLLYMALDADQVRYAGFLRTADLVDLPEALHAVANDAMTQRSGTAGWTAPENQAPVGGRLSQRIVRRLIDEPCILLHGPPGTGKTHAMREAAEILGHDEVTFDPDVRPPFGSTSSLPGLVKRWYVTFHQGIGYEDFVLGLRPKPAGPTLELVPRAGPLLEATEHARAGGTALLLIDELNRGNTARIFGDFISVLERDKRMGPQGEQLVTALPLRFPLLDRDDSDPGLSQRIEFEVESRSIPWPYLMPYHVYIVATMNDLDRSVAPLDAAFRRRFAAIEARIDYESLRDQLLGQSAELNDAEAEENDKIADAAVRLLRGVNRVIRAQAGTDFQLGPSYFWNIASAGDPLANLLDAWDERVMPQLRDYFRVGGPTFADLGIETDDDDEPLLLSESAQPRAALDRLLDAFDHH
jgi:MoxR-like ATPase